MTDTHAATDQQLQRAIVQRLDWTAGVRAEHIGVAVTDGAVTLSGEAASGTEKLAAVRAATEVSGVVAVVDEIVVRDAGGTVNDADVARSAQAMLQHHPQLRGQPVTATVHHHVVTLTGIVDRVEHRQAAERGAAAILGVTAVANELQVRPVPSAAETKDRIAAALLSGVESEIEHLRIELDGHVAVLEGTVHSWYERRAAERAARAVPGVTDVRNKIVVAF